MNLCVSSENLKIYSTLLLVICVAIIAFSIIAGIVRLIILSKYIKGNHTIVKSGLTGRQAAEKLLNGLGITDVSVKTSGLLRLILFGNSYSMKNKTIYLQKRIIDNASVTAVGQAGLKTGMAMLDKEGDKSFKFYANMQGWVLFAPYFAFTLGLLSVIVDALMNSSIGAISCIGVIIGFVIFLISLIYVLTSVKVMKKTSEKAKTILAQSDIVDEEELNQLNDLYKIYIIMYVVDFILSILYFIRFIFKALAAISKIKK